MNIKKELSNFKKIFDVELEKYLNKVIKETEKIDIFSAKVLKDCKENILAGGKRIRPILMYYGYLSAGRKDLKEIVKASISVELIHFSLLIHDDIIDRDNIRHGKETIHAKYKKYSEKYFFSKNHEHFGISIGIMSGVIFNSLGMKVLFSSNFEAKNLIKVLEKMENVVGRTCIGESQDVIMEYRGKATEEEILAMYENKTARYTFEGPLQLGAILAGANDFFCNELSEFAVPLGIAFQIQDDIIGVFGDFEKTGKPVGSDVSEGKITLLTLKAYEKANKEEKVILDNLLGKEDLTEGELSVFRQIVTETGALSQVSKISYSFLQKARINIQKANLSENSKEFLQDLINYLDNREF